MTESIEKDLILKEVPLFSGLSDEERNLAKERCAIAEFKKGQIIYREGAPADAFYCVILGRVAIYTQGKGQGKVILEYLHRGKYFGIISLLTGESHSVTAEAINDCSLLVIKKEDFNFLLKNIPSLAIDLSQTLSRRLKNKDIHQKTIFESTVISAFSSYSQAGKTIYALNLGLSLNKETHRSVIILDICLKETPHILPSKLGIAGDYPYFDLCGPAIENVHRIKDFILHSTLGIDLMCLSYSGAEGSCVRKLTAVLTILVNDYHYIILDLPSIMDHSVFDILNQSDMINILTSPEEIDLKKTRHLIERMKADFNFPENKIKVIINEYKFSKIPHERQVESIGQPIFATLPKIELIGREDALVLTQSECEYARAIRRISRQIGERLVGLALGVGFAYGFCHIGVLKVVEEEKIPIDAISGSSIGAVIAGLWAIGKSSEEILEVTKEFRESKYIWNFMDLTLPLLGFIKGEKLYNFLKKHFGSKTFHDIKIPLKIVASDVKRKESHIIEKGLLADAIMASCSMPGVFKPFKVKEEMLFDGGVINPLPTEVLFKMGVKKIIAVNVTPSRQDILNHYEKLKGEIGVTTEKKKGLSLLTSLGAMFKTNILDIIFSSIELLQSEVAEKEAKFADIVLHPDTSGLHWLELHRGGEFAKRGEEEMRRNLDKIWQVINE